MTKAEILKQFFKKFYNIDAEGKGTGAVLKDIIENNDSLGGGSGSSKKTMTIECEYDNNMIILNMAWQDIYNAFMDDYEIIINGEYSGQVEKVARVHIYTPSGNTGQPPMYIVETLVDKSIYNAYSSGTDTGKPQRQKHS